MHCSATYSLDLMTLLHLKRIATMKKKMKMTKKEKT